MRFGRWSIAVALLGSFLLPPVSASAASCEKSRDNAIDVPAYGSTVEFTRKIQINVPCTHAHNRLMDGGRNMFLGIDVTEYPKGILEYEKSAYGMTVTVKKVGRYTMRWTVNLKDQNGRPQFVKFVARIEAVKDAW